MRTQIFLTIGLFLLSISACKQEKASSQTNGMPVDFMNFYERFHQDSIYQIEHISFPLEGVPGMSMGKDIDENFHFKLENWKMHRAFEDSLIIYHSLEQVSDHIVEEEIGLDANGLMIYRRFTKAGSEWFLSYYMAPNFVQKQ